MARDRSALKARALAAKKAAEEKAAENGREKQLSETSKQDNVNSESGSVSDASQHNTLTTNSIDKSVNKDSNPSRSRTIQLPSGKEVTLMLVTLIGKAEIEAKTKVAPSNIRNKDWLTEERLSEMLADFREGYQILPGIAYRGEDGVDYVVDGSTRRWCAIETDSSYIYERSDQELDLEDAEFIVKKSALHNDFSDYEWGAFYLSKIEETGKKQKEIALEYKVKESDLSRYINLVKVDESIIDFIPYVAVLTKQESRNVIDYSKTLAKLNVNIEDFILKVQEASDDEVKAAKDLYLANSAFLTAFSAQIEIEKKLAKAQQKQGRPATKKPEPRVIHEDKSKKSKVLMAQDPKKRETSFVLKRCDNDDAEEIYKLIEAYYSKKKAVHDAVDSE
ncbi:hypothetical protein LRP52_37420 [Photobacterium sp. ZSDE20]|uniref:ParB/Sulfiredoxin domain-containing protein n=1 Tax=Photobacterium pectinilyticum TaxID=2906793 RepID=A0ABT1N116_9GAMM|nr:hypothetical protein [Photobacterium sp. ZSDE20]MCQ1058354.1 hypothetical protein [Photobacterium sp. ZSDE20]MDD1827869.1 hypothetical protein [Photobacterium sp. ZSDE20]